VERTALIWDQLKRKCRVKNETVVRFKLFLCVLLKFHFLIKASLITNGFFLTEYYTSILHIEK